MHHGLGINIILEFSVYYSDVGLLLMFTKMYHEIWTIIIREFWN